jgi:hypothetical protein
MGQSELRVSTLSARSWSVPVRKTPKSGLSGAARSSAPQRLIAVGDENEMNAVGHPAIGKTPSHRVCGIARQDNPFPLGVVQQQANPRLASNFPALNPIPASARTPCLSRESICPYCRMSTGPSPARCLARTMRWLCHDKGRMQVGNLLDLPARDDCSDNVLTQPAVNARPPSRSSNARRLRDAIEMHPVGEKIASC